VIGSTDLLDLIAGQVTDVETAWSIGTFGAIAEFTRDATETAAFDRGTGAISVVTARGGMRIDAHDALRPIASESLTAQSWNQRVALCLPEGACAMNRRAVLTEIGPDHGALRAEDRTAALFDLGLGTLQLDACVRSGDAATVTALRNWVGQSLFADGNGAMAVILAASPHRVFVSRVGRIEVFQPIPQANGNSPEGPHTHVLPKLLRHKRTHAATEALPAGWVPCAHFYPPHPMRDAFGHRLPLPIGTPRGFPSALGPLRRPATHRHQAARCGVRCRGADAAPRRAGRRPVCACRRSRCAAAVAGGRAEFTGIGGMALDS
jgi:hypothetical protein